MRFLLLFILGLGAAAYGLEWLLEQPGSLTVEFGGWRMESSIPVAVGALMLLVATIVVLWAVFVAIWRLPRRMIGGASERRRERGLDVLSQGLVAVGAGDLVRAKKAAQLARRLVPEEPLTQVLTAQAAQLAGDRQAAAKAFHEMTLKPETRLLGLRGLHIDSRRRNDVDAAHHFAKEAHEIAPVPWAGAAILEHHAGQGDWESARAAVEANYSSKAIDLETAQRLRSVIETAMSLEKESANPHDALHLARQALKRRPGFAPAAAVAIRTLLRHGDQKQALKLVETIWPKNPHPELGDLYLEALKNEPNSQRVTRVEKLAALAPDAPESRQLVARTALSAREFGKARAALTPLVETGRTPTAQSCLLMAEIEETENGDNGAMRAWLARASRAPRDPAWIADHIISRRWLPFSPASGKLDAFEWKAPPDSAHFFAEEQTEAASIAPDADKAELPALVRPAGG